VSRAVEARRNASPEALAALAPRVTGANPASQAIRYRKCPECAAFMHRRNFQKASGVIVDRCSSHGTWLDADELEQIAGFVLSGRRPAASLTDVPREIGRGSAPAAGGVIGVLGRRLGEGGTRSEGGSVGSLVDALFGLLK
jgi:Zn-finger nucleic acid-binding protein